MKRLLCALALFMLGVTAALAQDQVQKDQMQKDQVKVTSDVFVVEEAASEAVFTGNVVVERTGLTVWADEVVVEYAEGGMDEIESFVATGNVRLKTPDQDATGDWAHFDPDTQLLRLTGNVVVVNEAGTVEGPELLVDLEDNSSVFTGSDGARVTGVFTAQ